MVYVGWRTNIDKHSKCTVQIIFLMRDKFVLTHGISLAVHLFTKGTRDEVQGMDFLQMIKHNKDNEYIFDWVGGVINKQL